MKIDDSGQRLHDRVTRGEPLTQEERAQLDEWYAARDAADAVQLGLATSNDAVDSLRAQVDSTLSQVAGAVRRVRELLNENDVLRREIADLRRRVAQDSLQPG